MKIHRRLFRVGIGLGGLALVALAVFTAVLIYRQYQTRLAAQHVPALPQAELQLYPKLGEALGETAEMEGLAVEVPFQNSQLAKTFAAGTQEDPLAAERWFWEQRAYPSNKLPFEVHMQAVEAEVQASAQAELAPEEGEAALTWTSLGPRPLKNITYGGSSNQNASGRALAVAVHPTNANIVLVGAAQGGIWRSTDAAKTFKAVSDGMPSLAIKMLRFAPSDPNIVYAGTGEPHSSSSIYGQGVLKSTDGGATWKALPASGANWDFRFASVSGLQVHPTNPNIVYVTTAAILTVPDHFNPASVPQTGIFKSTDGGQTWTRLLDAQMYTYTGDPMAGSYGFMDLELARSNPSLLYATEYRGGIYKSIDAGATWDLMTPISAVGGKLPDDVLDYALYSQSQASFITLDTLGLIIPDFDRIELGLAQSDPDTVYAGYSVKLGLDADGVPGPSAQDIVVSAGLLFKSIDGGQTWNWLGDWARDNIPDYCTTQCAYDNIIEVNPTNENDVLIGGSANYNMYWPDPIDVPDKVLVLPWRGMVYRSQNGGQSFVDTNPHCTAISDTSAGQWDPPNLDFRPVYECTTYAANRVTHPDVHSIAFNPANPKQIYVANDGGLYRTTVANLGQNSTDYLWENLNEGLSTLQFYFFDVHPTDPDIMLGGLQDNAVAYWDGSAWDGWGYGDGIFGAFDPKDPDHVYIGTQFHIHRHDEGGVKDLISGPGWHEAIFRPFGDSGSGLFITPFEIDPASPQNVYAAASDGLYRSTTRGDTWSQVASGIDGRITSISVSPVNNQLVYFGTSTGWIYRYNTQTAQLSQLGDQLPSRYISKVEASANNANTLFLTFSGYNANTPQSTGKVFKSIDQGASWTNISGNLPDVPASALAVDPKNENRMWVGSDVGVYQTIDGGKTWTSYRHNMPIVAIMDMKYNATTHYLTVVTHGRGAWRIAPDGTAPPPKSTSTRLPLLLRKFARVAPLPVFKNWNFELGSNGNWKEESRHYQYLITNQLEDFAPPPVSGSHLAWMGGTNDEDSYLSQSVTIPPGSGPTYFYFYYQIRSAETNCNTVGASDYFRLRINGQDKGGMVLCNTKNTTLWYVTGLNQDLSAFAGQSLNFNLQVHTDFSLISHFFVDNVHFRNQPLTAATAAAVAAEDGIDAQFVELIDLTLEPQAPDAPPVEKDPAPQDAALPARQEPLP